VRAHCSDMRNGLDTMAPWHPWECGPLWRLWARGLAHRPRESRVPGRRPPAAKGTPGRLHRCAVAEHGHALHPGAHWLRFAKAGPAAEAPTEVRESLPAAADRKYERKQFRFIYRRFSA
jgi:hypothetical protein